MQDIDRADLGRSTFYAHYRDKESLLLPSFGGLRAELAAALAAITPGETPSDPRMPMVALSQILLFGQVCYGAGRPRGDGDRQRRDGVVTEALTTPKL